MLDILAINLRARIGGQVPQVPDCYRVIAGKVDATLVGEEMIAFPLVLHLRRHLLHRYHDRRLLLLGTAVDLEFRLIQNPIHD